MSARHPSGGDASIRRARFAVPVPAKETGSGERVRLVDPTGLAVAWLDCGEEVVLRAFHVRVGSDPWQELAHDLAIPIPGVEGCGAWVLVERDPTMAQLRWQGDVPVVIRTEVADGTLTISTDERPILVIDPATRDR